MPSNQSGSTDVPTIVYVTDGSRNTRAGWVVVDVPPSWEQMAREWRASRDVEFNNFNVFDTADSDERWVGELGEMVFDWWLRTNSRLDVEWIRDSPAGKPDFIASGWRIGAKTVKRKVPFQVEYCGQVSKRHFTEEPSDAYFFMSYQMEEWDWRSKTATRAYRMWLVGGCSHARFEKHAIFTEGPAVDPCNEHYRIRRGHSVYNCKEQYFTVPNEFVDWIGQHQP